MTKLKVIDQQHSVYSEVKLVGMTQIVKDGDDFRTYLELRYPPDEEYRRYKGSFHNNIDKAINWCREELTEENLKHIYEREEIVNRAMADFYSPSNRSKYDYNE